jgi:tetratricopeptide (TPR) repeat protein
MVRVFPSAKVTSPVRLCTLALVLLGANAVLCQQNPDWQQQVHEKVQLHQIEAALALVDLRLQQDAADMEAHAWRGRLLAWQGHWDAAESEYRRVLERFPNDTEVLCALADVLLWQGKKNQALVVINQARQIGPTELEILLRRARILEALQHTSEARSEYAEILRLDSRNRDAKRALAGMAGENKNELRIGADGSTFNDIGPAEEQEIYLTSHWRDRFTTVFETGFSQRFGQSAEDFLGSISFRFTKSDWLTGGSGFANHQSISPENEMFFEYGHGLRFSSSRIRGVEASYQQHWFWYQGAHVLTLNCTQIYYLPRDWTWTLALTGARSGFAGTGIEWVPSGYTRLGFHIHRDLSGDLTFGNGTENFAQIDQIGHFSARTYAGGLKYRFSPTQDIGGYVAVQDRSSGQTQHNFGASYGFRF